MKKLSVLGPYREGGGEAYLWGDKVIVQLRGSHFVLSGRPKSVQLSGCSSKRVFNLREYTVLRLI